MLFKVLQWRELVPTCSTPHPRIILIHFLFFDPSISRIFSRFSLRLLSIIQSKSCKEWGKSWMRTSHKARKEKKNQLRKRTNKWWNGWINRPKNIRCSVERATTAVSMPWRRRRIGLWFLLMRLLFASCTNRRTQWTPISRNDFQVRCVGWVSGCAKQQQQHKLPSKTIGINCKSICIHSTSHVSCDCQSLWR